MFDDPALITRERALEVIGEGQLRTLRDIQRGGWADWETLRATKEGSVLSSSARARVVYDATVRRALEAFPSSVCAWRHGLLVLDLHEVLVRFKKLDDEFGPRGIPTWQASAFEEQAHVRDAQMGFWPPKPMLIVGYVLDQLGTTIKRQALVLRRRGVMWWHDLSDLGGALPTPTLIPLAPPPAEPPAAAEVRSKHAEEEDRKEAR